MAPLQRRKLTTVAFSIRASSVCGGEKQKTKKGCVKAEVSLIHSLGSVHKTLEVTGHKGVWGRPNPPQQDSYLGRGLAALPLTSGPLPAETFGFPADAATPARPYPGVMRSGRGVAGEGVLGVGYRRGGAHTGERRG